jgi:hypothetical protein
MRSAELVSLISLFRRLDQAAAIIIQARAGQPARAAVLGRRFPIYIYGVSGIAGRRQSSSKKSRSSGPIPRDLRIHT